MQNITAVLARRISAVVHADMANIKAYCGTTGPTTVDAMAKNLLVAALVAAALFGASAGDPDHVKG